MSDTSPPPPEPPLPPGAIRLPPPEPPGRGLAIFWVVSGVVLLVLTLGCIIAVTDGNIFDSNFAIALLCGSPTLLLGAVALWAGTRRLR